MDNRHSTPTRSGPDREGHTRKHIRVDYVRPEFVDYFLILTLHYKAKSIEGVERGLMGPRRGGISHVSVSQAPAILEYTRTWIWTCVVVIVNRQHGNFMPFSLKRLSQKVDRHLGSAHDAGGEIVPRCKQHSH
jgi:hypothetical protein